MSLHASLARPVPRRIAVPDETSASLPDTISAPLAKLRVSCGTPPAHSMPCRIQLAAEDILRTCTVEDVDGLEELEKACKFPLLLTAIIFFNSSVRQSPIGDVAWPQNMVREAHSWCAVCLRRLPTWTHHGFHLSWTLRCNIHFHNLLLLIWRLVV